MSTEGLRVLLSTEEAAGYLKSTPGTLKAWRYQERGPLFQRSGRRVVYDLEELDRWLAGDRGECRAMTTAPPRQKLATLADLLPPDLWEDLRTEAMASGMTPAELIRDWGIDATVLRILKA